MAKGNNEVIKSFLVSLGFSVDDNALRKFTGTLNGIGGTASLVAKSVLAVAVAAEAMVGVVANSMEKLYYASKRTGATVGNLQALNYAFEKVGISGEKALDFVEAISKIALSSDPGQKTMLDRLVGVDTTKMEKTEAFVKAMTKLFSMGDIEGTGQAADLFGMDKQTYGQLKQFWPEVQSAMAERNEMLKTSGINADAAAKEFTQYKNELKKAWEQIEVMTIKIAHDLLPAFDKLIKGLNDVLVGANKLQGISIFPESWVVQANNIVAAANKIEEALGTVKFGVTALQMAWMGLGVLVERVGETMLSSMNLIYSVMTLDKEGIKLAIKGMIGKAALGVMKDVGNTDLSSLAYPGAQPQSDTRKSAGASGSWAEQGAAVANQAVASGSSLIPASGETKEQFMQRLERNLIGGVGGGLLGEMARLKKTTVLNKKTGQRSAHPGYKVLEGELQNIQKEAETFGIKVDINVFGASDSKAVAKEVASVQKDTFAAIIRDLGGMKAA